MMTGRTYWQGGRDKRRFCCSHECHGPPVRFHCKQRQTPSGGQAFLPVTRAGNGVSTTSATSQRLPNSFAASRLPVFLFVGVEKAITENKVRDTALAFEGACTCGAGVRDGVLVPSDRQECRSSMACFASQRKFEFERATAYAGTNFAKRLPSLITLGAVMVTDSCGFRNFAPSR